jgi:class 3 adenylate cyclase
MSWNPFRYHWRWQLKSSPAGLWPFVADTQRFNQAAALPSIEYSELPLASGGSQRIGRTTKYGLVAQFEDYPFDWIREQSFRNVRVFSEGPLARTDSRLTLEANGAGTLLHYEVEITPANLLGWLGTPYQFGWLARRNFGRVFQQIDQYLQHERRQPFNLAPKLARQIDHLRLADLATQLLAQGYAPAWVDQLTGLVSAGADLDLIRLRPYPLAERWQAPRRAILEMFLSAAKLGLLNMRWDLLCPLCRGAKARATSLDDVYRGVHCQTCNIDFEANFSQNVELTFTPHPQIRTVHGGEYCIGGPMITPHILLHQTIAPQETRTLQLNLPAQGYRFRTQQPGVEEWLVVADEPEQPIQLCIEAGPDWLVVRPGKAPAATAGRPPDPTATNLTLSLSNKADYPQRIFVERAEWYTDAVTAAQVTTMQHFRDLFSDEVLRPGEEIGVQGLTILFSDLVGSTAMYNEWGDAPSYGLVRQQFAFLQGLVRDGEGAIVKTIGDAIMAAFIDPAKAVETALRIQKEINTFNAGHPNSPLTLRLGLHHGPCIAVNLNGRLDYFGTTVNLAARLEGQSRGGDVVISDRLRHDPAVERLLAALPVQIDCFETTIKGFAENFSLFRLRW